MKISVLDDYHQTVLKLPSFSKLSGHDVEIWNDHVEDVSILAQRLANTQVLILFRERTSITAELLAKLPNLKLISQSGYYPHVDLDACTRHGVIFCSSSPAGKEPSWATTELTWALILMSLRELPSQIDSLKHGRWQSGVGYAAYGRALGIYAYGRLGAVVASYGRAFGMKVQVWGRDGSLVRAKADGYTVARSREAFFSESDVISLHMPLVEETRGIVKETDLRMMKLTAIMVNTSRAGLIERGALLNALRDGRPGKACLDVYDAEPLVDVADPLLNMSNVICTPHIGYVEMDSHERMFKIIFDQVLAFANGKPINVINLNVLTNT